MVYVVALLETWLLDNYFMMFWCCVCYLPMQLLLLFQNQDLVLLWIEVIGNVGVV